MNNKKSDSRALGIKKNSIIYPAPDADPMWLLNPQPLWNLDDIAQATHATQGQWISGYNKDIVITGVCYRKTEILSGDLYVPRNSKHWAKRSLRPPSNAEIKKAFTMGAVAIVLDEIPENLAKDIPVLLVDNTRKALYGLANFARNRFAGKVVGVTGSAGKTTVKEMLRFLLAQLKPTVSSRANFNHDVGVALSLAQTPAGMSYGVYEFGVDAPHLTALKAKMLKPDIAIVTEIFEAHLSHYKTLDKLVEQKSILFESLTENGSAILNHDSAYYQQFKALAIAKGVKNILTYGAHKNADIYLKNYELNEQGSDISVVIDNKEINFHLAIPGLHNIQNSLAVLASIYVLGEDCQLAAANFHLFDSIKARTQFYDIKLNDGSTYKLIDDVFNANTGSIKAGLKLLSLIAAKGEHRKIIVLGQMKKPGEQTAKLHSELVVPIMEENIDKIYTLGEDMLHLRNALPEHLRGSHGNTYKDIINDIVADTRANDIIFLKGPDPAKENTKKIVSCLLDKQNLSQIQTEFSYLFLGDTSFGESYQERYKREGEGNILERKGYDYPLDKMRTMLTSADLVIANLETPLTSLVDSPFAKSKTWLHRSDIKDSPEHLLSHNIHVVGLANNHSFDYGEAGFKETIEVLNKYHFNFFGGGINLADAQKPFTHSIKLNNVDFNMAIISCYKVLKKAKEVYAMYAETDKMGVNPLHTRAIKREIDKLRKQQPNTFVILFPHWGANYAWRTENQQKLAYAMIEAGADLIIGHGAHMIQEIEQYQDKWIIYSIGNFMFNSRGRYKKHNAPPYSLMAKLVVNTQSNKPCVKLFPIYTNNRITRFQPRFVDGKEFIEVYDLLKQQGSNIEESYICAERSGSQALFSLNLAIS